MKGVNVTSRNAKETSAPRYELRAVQFTSSDLQLEIWQLPAPATPNLKKPKRIAGLRGRNLSLIEHRLLKDLAKAGIRLASLKTGETRFFELDEVRALRLGLQFRVLAPMRKRANMRCCCEGVEAMGKEEAAYWLGMAMHRRHPRRVLMALRYLLIDPKMS